MLHRNEVGQLENHASELLWLYLSTVSLKVTLINRFHQDTKFIYESRKETDS